MPREIHACDAGIETTTIFDNQAWLIRRENGTGGIIVTRKRNGSSVYLQPGDDADSFDQELHDIRDRTRAGTGAELLSVTVLCGAYFD